MSAQCWMFSGLWKRISSAPASVGIRALQSGDCLLAHLVVPDVRGVELVVVIVGRDIALATPEVDGRKPCVAYVVEDLLNRDPHARRPTRAKVSRRCDQAVGCPRVGDACTGATELLEQLVLPALGALEVP